MLLVTKFGGSSVSTGEGHRQVASIVAGHLANGHRVCVVVSAMGDTTDHLVEACHRAQKGDVASLPHFLGRLQSSHEEAVRAAVERPLAREGVLAAIRPLFLELEKVLTGIAYVGEVTPRAQDLVLSFGERLSAPILAGALADRGIDAKAFTGKDAGIVTDSTFGAARPLADVSRHQVRGTLLPVLERGGAGNASSLVPVVTGYIAADQHGNTTTLGRSGSDYTATLLGAWLLADEIDIYSDVDGLMTADPRIVPEAKLIPELSFAEAMEMAYFGAKMMHPLALETAFEPGIPVRIRSTFKPDNPGTIVLRDAKPSPGKIVKAITLIRDVSMVTVSGAGMAGIPGTAARVFDVLGKQRVNVLMMSQGSSEVNITFVVPRASLDRCVNALELALLGGGVVEEVSSEDDASIIAAVGEGMKGTHGVAARIFGAVAKADVNVRMIAQGSSELNVSFVVMQSQAPAAVKALHEAFSLG
ncbi:MAG: aspartate kinase [Planctomycetota bacterium]